MLDVLGRIDNVIDRLCPCGGQPRDGSPYCSDDCVPNYVGADTTSDTDTQMRWWPEPIALHLMDNREAMLVAAQTYRRAISGLAEADPGGGCQDWPPSARRQRILISLAP